MIIYFGYTLKRMKQYQLLDDSEFDNSLLCPANFEFIIFKLEKIENYF
jgi:hypothetical protein